MRVISSILLFFIGIQCGGYYFLYQAQRAHHQSEVAEKISNTQQTTLLRFSKKNLSQHVQFVEENELIYEGEFYDLIKRETIQDSVVFHVYHDSEEKRLWTSFSEVFHHFLSPESSQNPPKEQNHLIQLIKPFLAPLSPDIPPSHFSTINPFHTVQGLRGIYLQPPQPPPCLG